jgi:p-aminobenzoyl-glutamate transporter AbgT
MKSRCRCDERHGQKHGNTGRYIVLVFFAAQFVAYFNWTNIGLIVAVKGAEGCGLRVWVPSR